MKQRQRSFWLIFFVVACSWLPARAQDSPAKTAAVAQFSGIVVNSATEYGLWGVHLYVPRTGRGTYTNPTGYFSMATQAGDSIIISAIGFKRQYYILPSDESSVSVVIFLDEDTTLLETVEILPFGTEKQFKEAFVKLELPEAQELANMERNLDPLVMGQLFENMPMDGSMNHTFYMQQQQNFVANRNFVPTLQLLNPFAWSEFIKSIRRGDLKKKENRRK